MNDSIGTPGDTRFHSGPLLNQFHPNFVLVQWKKQERAVLHWPESTTAFETKHFWPKPGVIDIILKDKPAAGSPLFE